MKACSSHAVEVDQVDARGARSGFEVDEHVRVAAELARTGVAANCERKMGYGMLGQVEVSEYGCIGGEFGRSVSYVF